MILAIDPSQLSLIESAVSSVFPIPQPNHIDYADATHDNGEIHRVLEIARRMNFEGTPLVGTHYAAIGARAARSIANLLRQTDESWEFNRHSIKFLNPGYPDQKLIWQIDKNPQVAEDVVKLEMNVVNPVMQEGDKKRRVAVYTAEFNRNKPGLIKRETDPLYTTVINVSESDISRYYSTTGRENESAVPIDYASAIIPPALLTFMDALNKRSGTIHHGANKEMGSTFLGNIKPGKLEIHLFPGEEKEIKRLGVTKYLFHGDVSQDGEIKTQGTVECIINGYLDIYSLNKSEPNSKP